MPGRPAHCARPNSMRIAGPFCYFCWMAEDGSIAVALCTLSSVLGHFGGGRLLEPLLHQHRQSLSTITITEPPVYWKLKSQGLPGFTNLPRWIFNTSVEGDRTIDSGLHTCSTYTVRNGSCRIIGLLGRFHSVPMLLLQLRSDTIVSDSPEACGRVDATPSSKAKAQNQKVIRTWAGCALQLSDACFRLVSRR